MLMKYETFSDKNESYPSGVQPIFANISSLINGFGRAIYFKAYGTDDDWAPNPFNYTENYVISVTEG